MHQAAQALVGEQDFSSFQAAACQSNTPFRFVEYVSVQRFGELVMLEIKANAFLLHMVRNIVGSLVLVGSGEKEISWIETVLNSKDRKIAGKQFPPDGLFLLNIEYDSKYNLNYEPCFPLVIE